jgi:hypothetical protein
MLKQLANLARVQFEVIRLRNDSKHGEDLVVPFFKGEKSKY